MIAHGFVGACPVLPVVYTPPWGHFGSHHFTAGSSENGLTVYGAHLDPLIISIEIHMAIWDHLGA